MPFLTLEWKRSNGLSARIRTDIIYAIRTRLGSVPFRNEEDDISTNEFLKRLVSILAKNTNTKKKKFIILLR